jgi:peroxiredoxin
MICDLSFNPNPSFLLSTTEALAKVVLAKLPLPTGGNPLNACILNTTLMKQVLLILALMACVFCSSAQIAPNFTVMDTEGSEWTLYDLLDEGQVVVLDLMFANCGVCSALTPYLQDSWMDYQQDQLPVTFIALTSDPADNSYVMSTFGSEFGVTFPMVGSDGGAVEAQQPYTTGDFGAFYGYPSLIVIAPDGEVTFDPWGASHQETIDQLEDAIENAMTASTSIQEQEGEVEAIYPIPASNSLSIQFAGDVEEDTHIEIINLLGSRVRAKMMTKGTGKINIDVSDLAHGTYLVRTSNSTGILETKRVQISR